MKKGVGIGIVALAGTGLILALPVACGQDTTVSQDSASRVLSTTPTTTYAPTAQPPTVTPTATATPTRVPPTVTPMPSHTPTSVPPTVTPTPTSTPITTPTPTPAATALPMPTQIPDRADLYQPTSPPEHMAYIWWNWEQGQKFRELVIDFTIHNDVADFSDRHGLYLMLFSSSISDVGFYFGLQTDVYRPERGGHGKGLIFSRWESRDFENARVAEPAEGWTQSSGHEGDFIGVRRSYTWGAGDYRISIAPDGADSDGEWYGVWITDLSTDLTTWAGSLKFPYLNGMTAIQSPGYSTVEIYGEPIRPIDIPEWHVSIGRPSGDGVKPYTGHIGYSPFKGELINSEARYEPPGDAIHFYVGGVTERFTPPQAIKFE